ncbi:hypothetical protein QBC35DRAFT_456430 [Podospora australis]|uniref:Glycan binding protein Y3-like domain-containing protein n=1 Tax=Podospora australis TaxID=1536484 RepID=A0AAN7ADL2_9PEZI|nr:hypothetical protein QBC35DRAFT_456430 [Podospora australis]
MKFSSVILFVAAAVSPAAASNCFTSGETWGDKAADARTQAEAFCRETNLNFSYNGEQRKSCRYLTNALKVEFAIRWGGSGTRTLGLNDCIIRLKDEINNCSRGGRTTTADWEFTADPNRGVC